MSTDETRRHSTPAEHEAELHGRELGREEGFQEGREIGHVEGLRLALTALYTARFGPVPTRIRAAIEEQEAFTELMRWNTALGALPQAEAEQAILGLDA